VQTLFLIRCGYWWPFLGSVEGDGPVSDQSWNELRGRPERVLGWC
jgi:hypothetical protein